MYNKFLPKCAFSQIIEIDLNFKIFVVIWSVSFTLSKAVSFFTCTFSPHQSHFKYFSSMKATKFAIVHETLVYFISLLIEILQKALYKVPKPFWGKGYSQNLLSELTIRSLTFNECSLWQPYCIFFIFNNMQW